MKSGKGVVRTVLLALLVSAASATQAVPLQDLLAGGLLTAGDKLFDQWSVVGNTGINVGAATVTALPDGGLDPGPGFTLGFSPSQSATGSGTYTSRELILGFRVSSTDPALSIKDASLGGFSGALSAAQGSVPLNCTPTGNPAAPCNDLGIRITESIYADAAGTLPLGSLSMTFNYFDGASTTIFVGESNFPPASVVFVRQDILLWAANAGDTANLSSFEARFSQTATPVPEPSSLLLVGLALAMLTATARRHAG